MSINKPPSTPPPPPRSPSSSYSSPPSPRNNYSPRRSSICTPTNLPQQIHQFQQSTKSQSTSSSSSSSYHRRTRSFRDPRTIPISTSPRRHYSNTAFDFELTQNCKPISGSSSSGGSSSVGSRRQRPFERTSSSSSSVSTATTFFNTSTESNASCCSGVNTRSTSGSVANTGRNTPSNWSVSSEYSTTSTNSKRDCVAKVAKAGGKLAYLASRRGSIGSNCSSVCSTPPNTPGAIAHARGRRQSSGNFLEVPFTQSFPQQQQLDTIVSSTSTPPSPSHHRPRVNSLPATSLFSSTSSTSSTFTPHLLSPTYYTEMEAYQHHATPYNPRSTITKSQDHLYRLRTFSITKQGDVVNCGDTFVRKSKSNNCISNNSSNNAQQQQQQPTLSDQQSTSPRKHSLSTSPQSNRSPRSSPCRRGSLSPRLVLNYPLLDASCCVSRDSTTGDSSDDDDEDEMRRDLELEDVEDDDEDEFEEELTMRELVGDGRVSSANQMMRYRVVLLGESGVGKSALVRQFMTSEYINTYDMSLDEEYGEREVSVLLDSKESQLVFIDHPCVEMSVENSLSTYEPHACVVVYSVTDKRSFEFASEIVRYLWQEGTTHDRSVILVGNKCDLARARVISTQEGKNLATSHDTKFIETSSGIQHNVDELLVGVLKQIRLREEASMYNNNRYSGSGDDPHDHRHNLSTTTAAQHQAKQMNRRRGHTPRGSIMSLLFTRELINKLCFLSKKAKSCENLHVL